MEITPSCQPSFFPPLTNCSGGIPPSTFFLALPPSPPLTNEKKCEIPFSVLGRNLFVLYSFFYVKDPSFFPPLARRLRKLAFLFFLHHRTAETSTFKENSTKSPFDLPIHLRASVHYSTISPGFVNRLKMNWVVRGRLRPFLSLIPKRLRADLFFLSNSGMAFWISTFLFYDL